MEAGICKNCTKQIEQYLNYCSWECQIELAKKNGGKIICPNNLPISCITADNSMLENEHANHPDYKFPVEIEYKGEIPADLEDWDTSFKNETHAFIYTDNCIVLTMYECCYYIWRLSDGSAIIKPFEKGWFLTQNSIEKIHNFINNKMA